MSKIKKPRKPRIPNGLSFYPSRTGKRWRVYRNGRKIGAALQGYSNLADAANNVRSERELMNEFAIEKALNAYKSRKR